MAKCALIEQVSLREKQVWAEVKYPSSLTAQLKIKRSWVVVIKLAFPAFKEKFQWEIAGSMFVLYLQRESQYSGG